MKIQVLSNRSGFSLVEAMIGVAILGISTLAATSFLTYQMRANRQLQASQSRDFILRQIQTNLASSRAVLTSKENIANQAYKYCVDGKKLADGTLDKTVCKNTLLTNGTDKTPFTLFSGQGSGAITGSTRTPQLYTAAGDLCQQDQAGCVIEASSWFVASCAGNTPTCAQADSIEFRYLVQKSTKADIVMKPASGFFADPTMVDAAEQNSSGISMFTFDDTDNLGHIASAKYDMTSMIAKAAQYCISLSRKCVSRLDGSACDSSVFSGWRLPTAEEINVFPHNGVFETRTVANVFIPKGLYGAANPSNLLSNGDVLLSTELSKPPGFSTYDLSNIFVGCVR